MDATAFAEKMKQENIRMALICLKKNSETMGSWGYGLGLGKLFGHTAEEFRQLVASHLHGAVKLPLSDKRCQYENLRTALIEAVGATGSCIAAIDSDFNRILESVDC